ncbi:MAG: glycosyltransferase [Gammaproteobacteria bacterium]|nr:glycosyltransferase [Gammaproteobacteria bacterium]
MSLKILAVIEKNTWIDAHIAHNLEKMGHTVTRFYFGECVCEFYGHERRHEQIKKNRDLVDLAQSLRDEQGLDLIFCYVYDDFLLKKYAKALSNLQIPMVNYNVDMPSQWYRQVRTARYFDLMLCGQPDNMSDLARYARKAIYFPMAAMPTNMPENFEKDHDVTFLGTELPQRRYLLAQLAQSAVPLSIYGKYWDMPQSDICVRSLQKVIHDLRHYAIPRFKAEGMYSLSKALLKRLYSKKNEAYNSFIAPEIIKGKLSDEALSTIFRRTKINIGLTRYEIDDPNKIGRCHMKLRDFEVPMAGGFYLVEKSPGYDQLFIDGKEIVTWQTFGELLEKIDYYLKHNDEREAIALAGQKRAMRDHTWEARFNTLFLELGLIK